MDVHSEIQNQAGMRALAQNKSAARRPQLETRFSQPGRPQLWKTTLCCGLPVQLTGKYPVIRKLAKVQISLYTVAKTCFTVTANDTGSVAALLFSLKCDLQRNQPLGSMRVEVQD